MADTRQVDIVLKWVADQQAANRASDNAKKLNSDLQAVGKTADTVSQRLAKMSRDARVEQIGADFGKMAIKIKDTDKAAQALEKTLKKIGATDDEVQRATSAFAGASEGAGRPMLSSTLRTLGREGRALPALNIPGAGISTDAISKVVATLGSLPPVALPVIGVLTALGAGFVAFESSLMGVKKATEEAVAANKAYYDLIGSGTTTDEAKKRLEELQRTQSAQQQELASIQNANQTAFRDIQKNTGDFVARIGIGLTNLSSADDELAKRHDELTKSITTNQGEIDALTRAMNDGTLASNDYRKALEEEAKLKSDAAIAGAQDEYNRQLKLQQDQLLTSSQALAKVTTAIQEQNAAQAALNKLQADKARGVGGVEVDKQIAAFQLQIARLGSDIGRYYDIVATKKPIEDAIEHEKQLAAARKEVDKVNESVQNSTTKYKEDLDQLDDKLQESLDNLAKSLASANLEAQIERDQKLADLAKESHDQEVETQQKYNDDKVKIEEDYQKRVQEIQKEFTRSSAQAIQDRDAVALNAAEEKRKSELEDAKTDHDSQLQERDREYAAEMRQLQKSNADKAAQINLAYQREYEQRIRKYNADLQSLYDSNARDRAARTSAYERQLADLRSNLQQNTALWKQAGDAIVGYVNSVVGTINNLIGGGNSAVASGAVSDPGSIFSDIFGFGGGSSSSASAGLGRAPAKSTAGLGGVNVAVNGVGMNRGGVIREITKQLNSAFDDAGF